MSGSAPTNNQAVTFEEQQASEADQKEAQRQQRLQQGQTLIDQIFNGQPVMGTKSQNFDWSQFNPSSQTAMLSMSVDPTTGLPSYSSGAAGTNLPAGYKAVMAAPRATPAAAKSIASTNPWPAGSVQANAWARNVAAMSNAPAASTTTPATLASSGRYAGQLAPTPSAGAGAGAGGQVWAVQGPDGKIYYQGDPLSYDTQYDTGQRTGGFDDAFYNAYNQKILDYYDPQETKQYSEAQRDLTYNLARAGTLNSSVAADKTGDLAYNDALAKASIVANANQQTGQLQNQIQANKEAIVSQLYATEDPTLTANLAQSSANASKLQDPTLTPGASFFTPALTAVGSASSGLLYPGQQYPSTAYGSAPATNQGNVASASGTGSGKIYSAA
jgi:hypothetical protein